MVSLPHGESELARSEEANAHRVNGLCIFDMDEVEGILEFNR